MKLRENIPRHCSERRNPVAFTLVEVMIASAIFFTCTFGILAIMSQWMKAAALLRRDAPTAGMVAAELFANTNGVEEGTVSDTFGDFYRGYRWTRECILITNGMYEVDIVVTKNGNLDSALTTYMYSSGTRRRF